MRDVDSRVAIERLIDAMFHSVWRAALGSGLRSRALGAVRDSTEGVIASTLSVRGERALDVRLECPYSTAEALAAAFLRKPTQELAADELQGVVDELVNILAGNLKGALPGRNELRADEANATGSSAQVRRDVVRRELQFGGWPCVLLVSESREAG